MSSLVHLAPGSFARAILDVALDELGNGESGGNNRGPHVRRYRSGDGTGLPDCDCAWCASFASFCLLEAASRCHVELPFKTSRRALTLMRNASEYGRVLDEPEVGALVFWNRGLPGSGNMHVGIAFDLLGQVDKHSDVLGWIDGNGGSDPVSVVSIRHAARRGWKGWRRRFRCAVAL